MASHLYRYRFDHQQLARLQKAVGGAALTIGSQTPVYFDVTADSTQLADLSGFLGTQGYTLDSTDPVTTPTEQSSAALAVGTFDIKSILWWDHFVTGNPGSSDAFGLMGWRTLSAGTGSTVAIKAGEVGRPGIARLEAGTSAAARGGIYLGDSVVGAAMLINASQNQIDSDFMVRPIGSIAVTDLERHQIGLCDTWTLDQEASNGVYVRYAPTTDLVGGWTLVTANGGTRSTSASGTVPVVNTWVRLTIRMTYPGGVPTARLLINGVAVGTNLTANIPAAPVSPGAMAFSTGSVVTEPMLDLDWTLGQQAAA